MDLTKETLSEQNVLSDDAGNVKDVSKANINKSAPEKEALAFVC